MPLRTTPVNGCACTDSDPTYERQLFTVHDEYTAHMICYKGHALIAMNAFCALVLNNGSTAMTGAMLVTRTEVSRASGRWRVRVAMLRDGGQKGASGAGRKFVTCMRRAREDGGAVQEARATDSAERAWPVESACMYLRNHYIPAPSGAAPCIPLRLRPGSARRPSQGTPTTCSSS